MFTDQSDKDGYSIKTFKVTLGFVKLLVNAKEDSPIFVVFKNLHCFKNREIQNCIVIRGFPMLYDLGDVGSRYSFSLDVSMNCTPHAILEYVHQ